MLIRYFGGTLVVSGLTLLNCVCYWFPPFFVILHGSGVCRMAVKHSGFVPAASMSDLPVIVLGGRGRKM